MITLYFICLAGCLWGVLQTLAWHFESSVFSDPQLFNQQWWNPDISYTNKNKNNSVAPPFEEKFFGSRTFLVWTTDAWHLIDKLFITATMLGVILYKPMFGWFLDFCIYYFAFTVCFELVWRLVKKAV